jgi:hypothetical protein
MLKLLPLVPLFFLFVLSLVPTISAQDEVVWGLIDTDVADIRVGPDFAYPIILQIPRDTSVQVVGRAGDFFRRWDGRQWVQIIMDGGYGWIYARLVRTSEPFNSLPPRGLSLPRDRDGQVPEEFDLSVFICDRWVGEFTRSGDFMAGDTSITVYYPEMPGTVNYSVIFTAPSGRTRTIDSQTTSLTVELTRLNFEPGTYTWSVIPYWNDTNNPYRAQQLCYRRVGGTFDKPDTTPQ